MNSNSKRFLCLAMFALIISTGCTSIRTTPLDRSEDGSLTPNFDRPLKGVPVMLPVPTHFDVKIVQVDYWTRDASTNKLELIKWQGQEFRNRHVETELIKTNQMFVVDPKRPASGSGVYQFGFVDIDGDKVDEFTKKNRQGQLASVGYKSVDTTLKDSFALYSQIRSLVGVKQASIPNQNSNFATTERTIAFRRFRLNAPGVDEEVQQFVQMHLNECDPGCAAIQ